NKKINGRLIEFFYTEAIKHTLGKNQNKKSTNLKATYNQKKLNHKKKAKNARKNWFNAQTAPLNQKTPFIFLKNAYF
ncbi:hypothetical protein ACTHRR_11995, partial [Neisseria sp. P0003.S003]|uniref:hypothetical protein n=1 Tax=Neisseria sp. P0003.S003 TaxID=3436658 RepID=UPI003F7E14A6